MAVAAPHPASLRPRRRLRLSDPQVHAFTTADGARLQLTRYQGGDKGPVILSPGFGTSGRAFSIDTTDTNLPEYLFAHGYDVWVFDYRASPELPSAATQFTLDDIATHDYPAAVRTVREISGADSVQMMAHCVGSLTFLMALARGLTGVRAAVSSALTLHPVGPALNRLKSRLRLAHLLSTLGVNTLTTDPDVPAGWKGRLYDRALRLYPSKDHCDNPVCRRILFMYGEVYDHHKLNEATHRTIHEVFGVANLTTFKQLSLILNRGHAVDAHGQDVYLAHPERLRIPIAFIHGENNRLFLPQGSADTYKFLCDRNGAELYVRHVLPNYAHMDCFIGQDAARDVYPVILAELEKSSVPAG